MARFAIVSLAIFLCTAVQASNPVFGAYRSSTCDSCLDETYQSCPGDYKTRSYAACLCIGDGSKNFVTCTSYCDEEAALATATFYTYCLMFFKEMCPYAEQFIDAETFNQECSKEAIAAGGIGANSDSEAEASATAEPSATTGSASEEAGKTSEASETSKTSKTSETAQSTSGATPNVISAWAIMAGLGLQLINV